MTHYEDEQAMVAARKNYMAGWVQRNGHEPLDLSNFKECFDRHWRFIHCTKCGYHIDDQKDIGNVEFDGIDASQNSVTSRHKVCPTRETRTMLMKDVARQFHAMDDTRPFDTAWRLFCEQHGIPL